MIGYTSPYVKGVFKYKPAGYFFPLNAFGKTPEYCDPAVAYFKETYQ